MVKTNRRGFLKGAALGMGSLALGAGGIRLPRAWAAGPTLTTVTYLTPAYEDLFPPIQGFVDRLKEKHSGAVQVDFFHSGTLVKADDQTAALRAGTIHVMFHTSSYITRTFPILGITGLPGLVDELYRHGERLAMEGPLWKLINEALAKDNTFMLTAGGAVLEPEYIWSGSQKVASLADLKGKRCRIVSYEAEEALKPYGAAAARIPSSELYLAVQRGTVDATLANIGTVMGRKLYEQVKYCYKLPVTGFTISIFLLKSFWEKLPDNAKAALWDAGKWYEQNSAPVVNNKFYPEVYWPRIKQAGIQTFEPSQQELEDFRKKSQPVWDWWKKQVGEAVGQKAIDLSMGKA